MDKTVIVVCVVLFFVSDELCDITMEGGICLYGDETVYMPIAIPDKLVGYWTFDDDYGLDYSGNKNHALSPPTPGPGRGGKGNSASFTGQNYLEVSHSDSFDSKIFSMTFWVFIQKDSSTSGDRWCPIVQKGKDEESDVVYERAPAVYYDRQDKFLKVYISTDEVVNFPQGEYVLSNARIPYYRWHHIGIVRTQSRIRLYVNGIIDAVNSTDG